VLEQIRILSNLETDKEKLLQIILVGQLNLQTQLRSPGLRQLDQRVSIRYELKPLDAEAVAAYVVHRLTIAGGGASVAFTPKALREVHRRSSGIPRLINLICDRSLLTAYSIRANRVTPDMVTHAATSLDVQAPEARPLRWLRPRASMLAPAALVLLTSSLTVAATALVYQRLDASVGAAAPSAPGPVSVPVPRMALPAPLPTAAPRATRQLPAGAALTILVSSHPIGGPTTAADVGALTDWLESSGFPVFYAEVDLGSRGRWQRVLAGAYTDPESARRDAARLKAAAPQSEARLVGAGFATGLVATVSREPDAGARHPGTEP
jgi:general secretion pathway protein A